MSHALARRPLVAAGAVVLAALALAIGTPDATGVAVPSRSAAAAFQRVVVVQLENRSYDAIMANAYFASVASRGVLLTNYYAVAHPSQPNYIAQIAGQTLVGDDLAHDLPQANLIDLLEEKSVSWKAYMEDYPGACYTGTSAAGGLYVRKHNPFVSFDSVRTNGARCAKIVNASQFDADVAAQTLPRFSYYTPNQKNNSHNTDIAYAASWLQGFLEPKLADAGFMSHTLVVVTFDEDDGKHANHIYTVLLSADLAPGVDATAYTHYSLLRTIEDTFALGTLGQNDAAATAFGFANQPPSASATPTNGPSATPANGPSATPANGPSATPAPQPTAPAGDRSVYLPVVMRATSAPVGGTDRQPAFPVRAAFYYPWFPESWRQSHIFPYTHYSPTLGYYDLSDPAVIAEHLRAMRYGNIGAAIASWWGPGEPTDTHLADILAQTAASGSDIRWSVYYEKESLGDPSVADLRTDLKYLQAHHGSAQGFWRVDGRFVVFVYADSADGCGMADRWSQANSGINAYLVLKVFSGYADCVHQPDEWHQYSPLVAVDQQGAHSFSISPGFWLVTGAVGLQRDPERWRQSVRAMTLSKARLQLITTFNEWGEGTAVESAAEWSSASGHGAYLDALHENGAP